MKKKEEEKDEADHKVLPKEVNVEEDGESKENKDSKSKDQT